MQAIPKNLNSQWTEHEVPGTNQLLFDGHSSHFNLEPINLAKKNGVIMFTLVPPMQCSHWTWQSMGH